MIAVVGATGNTGRSVVKELKVLGEDPVCVVRNADKAREVLGPDAKVAVAEITDRAAMEQALKGSDRVFLVTGHNPDSAKQQINILEAAKAAGVKHIVKVSGGRKVVGPEVESIVGRGHHEVEQAIAASGLGYVILRPGLFMQNTLAAAPMIKNDSKMVLPFPPALPLAFIDVRDTGALGARVIQNPAPYHGQTLEFTGKLSNFGEFAQVFSDVLGRPITYVGASLEQAEAAMKGRGMPDWLIGHQLAMARAAGEGAFANENTKPIEDIVGRAPITTTQFVTDYKGAFS